MVNLFFILLFPCLNVLFQMFLCYLVFGSLLVFNHQNLFF